MPKASDCSSKAFQTRVLPSTYLVWRKWVSGTLKFLQSHYAFVSITTRSFSTPVLSNRRQAA